MAVADVALQMGPRNTRRVITGGAVLGVVAALAALFVLLTRSPNQSGSGLSAPSARGIGNGASGTPISDEIASLPFGMPKQQVRLRLGAPAKVVGRCWQYAVNEEGYTLHGGKKFNEGMVNAERLCFGWPGSAFTSKRIELNGSWLPPE